jgi:YD repeat-containing protein
MYCIAPRDNGVESVVGDPLRLIVPSRYAGAESFIVEDVAGVVAPQRPVRLPTTTMLSMPAQYRAGVVKVTTSDGAPVLTATVNASTSESRLDYHPSGAWKSQTDPLVVDPSHVVEVDASRSMRDVIQAARTGSELWPLLIVLAIACAVAEMLVARFMAQDRA